MMEGLHEDIQKAMDAGELQFTADQLSADKVELDKMAITVYSLTQSFKEAGFTELSAIYAAVNVVMYESRDG